MKKHYYFIAISLMIFLGSQYALSFDNEIAYMVNAESNYPDPGDVLITTSVLNHSKNVVVMAFGEGLLKVKLIGPDAKPVPPYPYRQGRTTPSYFLECLPTGGRRDSELSLSSAFAFPLAGEYRCIVTTRVYKLDSAVVPDVDELMSKDYYGEPINVATTEFRFRVQKASPSDKITLAADPSNHKGESLLEYDTMPTKAYPVHGEGNYKRSHSDQAKSIQLETKSSAPDEKKGVEARSDKPDKTEKNDDLKRNPLTFVLIAVVLMLLWRGYNFFRRSSKNARVG